VYHVELRKFPHTVCRFNQSEQQVRALVVPWVNEEWIEEGERKWNSNEATLTVLEGPKLSMPELAMGRGWRNAQRRSEDVTERVLGAARAADETAAGGEGRPAAGASAAAGAPRAAAPRDAAADSRLLADSLGLELLAQLDAGSLALSRAWSLAAERLGDGSAAESLALAELAVRSLVARGLVVLCQGAGETAATDPDGVGAGAGAVAGARVESALRAVESWGGDERASLQIARRV
jgi:hypothetical protein